MLESLRFEEQDDRLKKLKDSPAKVLRKAVELGNTHGIPLTREDKIEMLKEAYEIERQSTSENNSGKKS